MLWTCSVAHLLKVVGDIRAHCQVSVGIQKMLDLEVGFVSWSSMCTLCVEEFRRSPGRPVGARGSTGRLHPRTKMCQLHHGTTWCAVCEVGKRQKRTFYCNEVYSGFRPVTRCMVGLQILYAVASVAQRSGTEKVGRARLSKVIKVCDKDGSMWESGGGLLQRQTAVECNLPVRARLNVKVGCLRFRVCEE